MDTKNGCLVAQHVPRILLSLLFIVGGLGFLMDFSKTVGSVAFGLTPWGLAGLATLFAIGAIILKLGGGLMLLLNIKTSWAAWMLIIFTVFATLMFHMTWSGAGNEMQMTAFLKNLAIIGGLLLFADCCCKTCRVAKSSDQA